ncbi:Glutamate dehydrogenase 1 (NADP-dependent) [Ectocarpus siliculosus]|uniref:glutamate dehydrogenase (NADP(+)) n=1 Tax=Ectocarpus siliculosus TaxID=2880 RepID=D8LK56_ECTSI|nr:Glutamate dehydrogenase 1 (NADP-dependent) [Ectocarpus siliculosus]|eukprot:CBN74525.1 Glutamate dehydrogenase 1 (NADP-dependent) [Ectocarpus siliculosus]
MATRASSMLRLQAITTRAKTPTRAVNFNQAPPTSRSLVTRSKTSLRIKQDTVSPLYRFGGVHGSGSGQKTWRNKPLFRREGDQQFRTGAEATEMLLQEALRKDPHSTDFLESLQDLLPALAPVFDRAPKYAWIAKQLLEPERAIQFRVAWLDDNGNSRMNRGFRVQYSSALGPYEGGLHFVGGMSSDGCKALGMETVFANALTGSNLGAAAGGADFNPHNKSEAEIQRFCQSYMTEMTKYIGPDLDVPSMGYGVGLPEVGYLYGQYKRINDHVAQRGRGVLWGGAMPYPEATGYGVVEFARCMLEDKGDSLKGKRCLITGSGKVAVHVAEKLLQLGAIPLTFSDSSGHIYEPEGIDSAKLRTIVKIKSERGARVGRYIIASTTAQYTEPANIFDIPCDLAFACSHRNEVDETAATLLADTGCSAVIEGASAPCTKAAKAVFRKRGLLFAPHVATLAGSGIVSGLALATNPVGAKENIHDRVEEKMKDIFADVKATATEFNARGDYGAGATISGFMKVADVMLAHGAV